MLIASKPDFKNKLEEKVILITGAGGGIGYETAKAFAYMGAEIIVAEIDISKGEYAQQSINNLLAHQRVKFYPVDLADETQLRQMFDHITANYGCPDVVIHNATYAKMGSIDDVDITFWDRSYAVNVRAPILMTQQFLKTMKERNHGIIVFVSSSGASPFMGAYEIFKTAQVELSNTLSMELENTDVYVYTIGPGLVKTETAMQAIEIVASKMNMSLDQFYAMNSQHILSVEEAATGFALSVLNASNYHGQEIGSIQVLIDSGMMDVKQTSENSSIVLTDSIPISEIKTVMNQILSTLIQQSQGWNVMNIFERQWVMRDFKKHMKQSPEQAIDLLHRMVQCLICNMYSEVVKEIKFFNLLSSYWQHQLELLHSYEKDKSKREEHSHLIQTWIKDIDTMITWIVTIT